MSSSKQRHAIRLGDRPGEMKLKRMLRRASSSSSSNTPASSSHKKQRRGASSTDDVPAAASSGHRVASSAMDARAKAVELLEKALIGGGGGGETAAVVPEGRHFSSSSPPKDKEGEEKKEEKEGVEERPPPPHTVAVGIEEALHAKWSAGGSSGAGGAGAGGHGYNDALRHLIYNLKREAAVRGKILAGGITPLALVAMTADDFLTNEEREDALRKGRHSLVLSAAHTFSEVLFDQQQAVAAGTAAAGGDVPQCKHCNSTKVLFSRRQTYNESSTWCAKEEGVMPVMMNCLACGAVESQRD